MGHAEPEGRRIVVEANQGTPGYGICSSEFLEQAFRTDSYRMEVEIHDDGSWSYTEDTVLMVRGRTEPFVHKDSNRLTKVADVDLNPWFPDRQGEADAITS